MRYLAYSPINASAASANNTSAAIDMNQIFKMSAQVVAGAGTATGTVQLQVSNDHATGAQLFQNQTFTNWSNLGSAVTVTTAGATLVAAQDMCYKALRAVFTSTFANITTVTAIADVAGSLNSKYFLASSVTANYYFWMDNGSGVDPMIAGKTGIQVTYTNDDTADTIGGLIRTAAASKGWTVTGATNVAILTNSATGPSLVGSAGTSGFTVANTQPTSSITVNILCLGM